MAKIYYEILKSQETGKKKRPSALWVIPAALPLFILGAFYILRTRRSFADGVINGFSAPFRSFMGRLCSNVGFSVMEMLYILFGLFVLFFIIRSVVLTVRGRGRRLRVILKRIAILLSVALYIWSLYCFTWGIDYYGPSFSEKSGLSSPGVTTEELAATADYFLERANELSSQVPRDMAGHFNADIDELLAESPELYGNIKKTFDFLEADSFAPKKMIFSNIMSRMGFTGIYFPFTGESNINIENPACMIPCTVAHELSHQQGIYSEAEANFLGVAACTASSDPVYEYSGYISGLIYLMNSLYSADRDAWTEIRSGFSSELETDWLDNNSYWRSMESGITDAANTVYNAYLKSNGQELGIRSYGACVDLLVLYYAPSN